MPTVRRAPTEAQGESGRTARRERAAPEQPTDMPRRSWGGVLKRTVAEYRDDNLGDLAAALTYYGIQAIFPAMIALVSILGLIGHSATQPLITHLGSLAPGPDARSSPARCTGCSARRAPRASCSSSVWPARCGRPRGTWRAFMRASNIIYEMEEGRPIYKTIPVRLGVTIVLMALLVVGAFAVVVTGGLAKQVGNLVGVGSERGDRCGTSPSGRCSPSWSA